MNTNCKTDAEMNVVFIIHILLLYQKMNLNVSLVSLLFYQLPVPYCMHRLVIWIDFLYLTLEFYNIFIIQINLNCLTL